MSSLVQSLCEYLLSVVWSSVPCCSEFTFGFTVNVNSEDVWANEGYAIVT